jgi:hypothetical protein
VADNGLDRIKRQRIRPCMVSGANVKFAAMPGTDYMAHIFIVPPAMNFAIGVNVFNDSLEYTALAHRAALMRTHITPSVKCTAKLEDPDFYPTDDHEPLLAIFEGTNRPYSVFGHIVQYALADDFTILELETPIATS